LLLNYLRAKYAELRFRGLKIQDPWFYSHFVTAANQVGRHLARFVDLRSARVLDFGCGDGYMALGLLRFNPQTIVGVDLNPAYERLPERAGKYLGTNELPGILEFQKVREAEPLPFEEGAFEAVYAWSVFEHVSDLNQVLQELYRVLKAGGILFIQIEPLYYSPFGSHLQRLIPEPWAHLKLPEEVLLQQVMAAEDQIASIEKDLAYQSLEFETYKQFLINEYRQLNRVTIQELIDVTGKYFRTIEQQRFRSHPYSAPPNLLTRYSEADLLSNEIQLTLQKGEWDDTQVLSSIAS
jgi:ubiquinone/menaquinone biosynthesis C-methylase UbiE